jgi:hypothetical protein
MRTQTCWQTPSTWTSPGLVYWLKVPTRTLAREDSGNKSDKSA